jgi:hypothetical protein
MTEADRASSLPWKAAHARDALDVVRRNGIADNESIVAFEKIVSKAPEAPTRLRSIADGGKIAVRFVRSWYGHDVRAPIPRGAGADVHRRAGEVKV